jgi:hypothetical protein
VVGIGTIGGGAETKLDGACGKGGAAAKLDGAIGTGGVDTIGTLLNALDVDVANGCGIGGIADWEDLL